MSGRRRRVLRDVGDEMNGELFDATYDGAKFPPPRPFQDRAHEMLRDGYKHGHKNQIIMASTGAGKTVLAMRIIHEALLKGKRAVFVCDRTVLINQTSAVADSLGIDQHGIIQANHWRRNERLPFQIASAQTLAKRQFWPDADVIVVDECFTGDVEILTQHGFIRFDELPHGIKCAQFEDGRITFVSPTAYIDKPYVGDMVWIHSKGLCDLTMTPDHELLMRSTAGWKKFSAKDAPLNQRWEMATAGEGVGDGSPGLSAIERLYICLQADGSIHNRDNATETSLSFTFVKQRKINRFLTLMQDGGFRFSEVKTTRNRRRFLVHGLPLMSKRVWEHFDLASMSAPRARAIIAEMVKWDGSKPTESCWYYSSVDKPSADFFQCVALLAGYKTRMTVQRDERSKNFSDVHRLFIQINRSMIGAQRIKREIVKHDGHVYCIRVPAGNIVVRRGGKVVVTGNCHTRHKIWTEHALRTKAAVIGLSATPFSKGLGKIFSNLINATTMNELVQSGVLVPLRVLSGVRPDMRGARLKASGEWNEVDIERRGHHIIGDVVAEWIKHANNAKTIVFGATIRHCEDLCRQFNEAGVMAMTYTSDTNPDEREEILKEFKKSNSSIRVLASVAALAKGFDQPDVGCICDCRPLRKSLSEAIQMWGRGLRSAPSKKECLLLDHSGNIQRFREDFEDIYFNGLSELDSGEKLDKKVRAEDEKTPHGCPQCGYKPFHKHCMACGYEKPRMEQEGNVPGQMVEWKILGGGKKGKLEKADRENVWRQVCSWVRENHKNPATMKGRAYYLYHDLVGNYPSNAWKFEATPDAPISLEVYNKIRSRNIAYARGSKKARRDAHKYERRAA
jgi:superfamily II DNA or RNA helicase